jgi:RNA polymerase-binding transcription factor DksA
MASVLKSEEMEAYRQALETLRARLRGDVAQMTNEALYKDGPGGSSGMSSVPLHMADLGSDNYDQEFTLELIENEQGTLELINDALDRISKGSYGLCDECGEAIAKPRLQAIPYALHCIQCARKLENGE